MAWAVGRLGARARSTVRLNAVVPADVAGQWLERLMDSSPGDPVGLLAVMQFAAADRRPLSRPAGEVALGRGPLAPAAKLPRRISSSWSSMAVSWTARSKAWSSANRCRRDCDWGSSRSLPDCPGAATIKG